MRADQERAHPSERPAPRIACILGMHRSGTSVVARMVNLLGAQLGPDHDLVAPAADNPTGFWEHDPIVRLNDALLARLGGRSFAPPALPVGWETVPELDDLRERARAIVRESFHGAPLWAWKDPRTCLTLAFWQRLLPPMHYVVCVRNPVDVARSLAQRNRVAPEVAAYLWLRYTRGALSGTAGAPRCLSLYDRLLDDPAAGLAALAGFLGIPERAADPGVQEAIGGFLDVRLRHHHTPGSQGPSRGPAADRASAALRLAEEAYFAIERTGSLASAEVDALLERALASVSRRPTPGPPADRAG